MNVLLTNIHSIRNAGDHALMQMAVRRIREIFPGCSVTLSMDDPDKNIDTSLVVASLMSWLKTKNQDAWVYKNWFLFLPAILFPIITYRLIHKPLYYLTPATLKELMQGYIHSDLVISGPGGFLYSSGRGLAFLISVFSILLGGWAGKPVYLFPQSIGPLRKKWEYRFLKYALKKVRLVLVREPISLQFVRDMGLRCLLVPDLAFGFPRPKKEEALSFYKKIGLNPEIDRPWLGVTTIDWENQNRRFKSQSLYEMEIQSAVRFFIQELKGKVLFFPHVVGPARSRDDRRPANRIFNNLKDLSDSIFLITEELSPEQLKSLYGCLDLFIGTRLHSVIFALSEGVPSIGIGYQPKTRGVFQMLEIEDWVIDMEQMEGGTLLSQLIKLWTARHEVKKIINRRIPTLIQEIQKGTLLVAKDYYARKDPSF